MAKAIAYKMATLIRRRTRIIATLGPVSSNAKKIDALISAGVDVFRLNMSHGNHQEHAATAKTIRKVAKRRAATVAIMADLCGPKIRVGRFADGMAQLSEGDAVVVSASGKIGSNKLIPCSYKTLANDVKPGEHILLKDGLLELQVKKIQGKDVHCVVRRGGELMDNNGLHVPGVRLSSVSCMSKKDRADAKFALDMGVDFIALSFVREGKDVDDLRRIIKRGKHAARIVAKIELVEALQYAEEIVSRADAIMVARGDLGVELKPEQVPAVQQQLLQLAREHKKPVIVATQMLESMVSNPRPTRAEVTDVAHAVGDGADGIMLSAETAIGKHAEAAVQVMNKTAREIEGWQWHNYDSSSAATENYHPMMRVLRDLSKSLGPRSIVVFADEDHTVAAVSALRPATPIIAITTDPLHQRQLLLNWGVIPLYSKGGKLHGDQQRIELARKLVRDLKLAKAGQTVLLVGGFNRNLKKGTPTIQSLTV